MVFPLNKGFHCSLVAKLPWQGIDTKLEFDTHSGYSIIVSGVLLCEISVPRRGFGYLQEGSSKDLARMYLFSFCAVAV